MLLRMEDEFSVNDFGGDAVLYFSADWCGPCKIFSPELDNLSEEEAYEDFHFFQIPDENRAMFEKYEVTSHPVLMLIKKGNIVARFNGVMDMENQASKDIRRLRKLIKSLYGVG